MAVVFPFWWELCWQESRDNSYGYMSQLVGQRNLNSDSCNDWGVEQEMYIMGEVGNMEEANRYRASAICAKCAGAPCGRHRFAGTGVSSSVPPTSSLHLFAAHSSHTSLHLALRMATSMPLPNDIRIITLNLQRSSREMRPRPSIICADVSIMLLCASLEWASTMGSQALALSGIFLFCSISCASSLFMWGLQGWCSWQAWVEMVPKFAAGQSEGCQAVGKSLVQTCERPLQAGWCRWAFAISACHGGLQSLLYWWGKGAARCTEGVPVLGTLRMSRATGMALRQMLNPFWVACRPRSKALRHASFSEGEGLEHNTKWAHLD